MKGKDVLVTGGSGFVGSAVSRALIEAGFSVRVLTRGTSPRGNLSGLDVEIVEGDMRDPDAVARAMAGVQFLFHVAADYRLWARDPREIHLNNVEGTRIVMQNAQKAKVERVIYTSSVATLAFQPNGSVTDETMPLCEAQAIGAYKRSKIAAERMVTRMIREEGLPAIIVHPSTPIGPRDIKPTPTGRIIVEAARGNIPGFVDTGLNLVHVDDVASGHLAALRRGEIGGHYILGGQNVAFSNLLAEIARLGGHKTPKFRIPRPLVYPFAYAAEARARLNGRTPFLTLDGLRMSKHHMFVSSAKAERELGYHARPYQDALIEAFAWFRDQGYLGLSGMEKFS
ncbi:hopanoid-associated sugar epimerase [Beijerinckia indica]|uniref:Hopanoid-associated sugar epimerase n=1 Tax=Beijerinckia indica subsp. indica (strain ATCC 9039 / DSM 1715 / NCIMB 8712) TaxID=395963 RepID=B2ICB6_BEII9|nr:hopanoid-associated sugar epimerase [Beijerinckia indica]ACB96713.1 hopanoid-associated sugar epimerase [Beijerinckia indica subsp. indica ATCC 9039]